ncbi:MAG TPA: hypothetical protein VN622_04590 [Clostridia bacterium]|nr:hypothetical protein [Clostridia bacterium]
MASSSREASNIDALSILTLNPAKSAEALRYVAALSAEEREEFLSLADSNHVVIRPLEPLANAASAAGNADVQNWATAAISRERDRIANALTWLERVCNELEAAGCRSTVMKSLDHWPDLGNDLDLYSTADERNVCNVMTSRFKAHVEPRSWGDRLANKWNFAVPGLPEAIEVHAKRLGQTGEHTLLAQRFVSRRMKRSVEIDGKRLTFNVPAPEERVIVATLQRMYRHFYFRVCDIVNTMNLVESGTLDFNELKRAADLGGIWRGVCSFLKIASDYVQQYRGTALPLPKNVLEAAPFGGEKVYVRARFIRVPIMPQGAELYTEQVTKAALRGDVPATFRLSLLPGLASAAAISYKLTGSDKGIW